MYARINAQYTMHVKAICIDNWLKCPRSANIASEHLLCSFTIIGQLFALLIDRQDGQQQ